VELGAFNAVDPSEAEVNGPNRICILSRNMRGRIAVTVPAQVSSMPQSISAAPADRARDHISPGPERRSDQVSPVLSWATTRRNPASNSVISNRSRWF
jgi:hypothetical protein